MFSILWLCAVVSIQFAQINSQSGPDPWHYDNKPRQTSDEYNIPPDIRMRVKTKAQAENKLGIGEWFFRRTLAIILKGGQTQQNEDGSVDISLQMKYEPKQWETLEQCLKSDTPLSEDMLRKTIGYVQESIYKPSIAEKIVMAWSDYVQSYLVEYKTCITWTLSFLAAAGALFWLWIHMSHKHVIIALFIIFYGYEVIISYKEAEKNELDKFLSAVDRCKWYFWKSTCEVPPPDPLIFLKHMNPLKIAMRMCTTALAEPFLAFSDSVAVMVSGLTGGLWYPFDKITYAILTVIINISLIYFSIMIMFNWLLNTPFHMGFGFGLFGISVKQRNRTLFSDNAPHEAPRVQNTDRISDATVDKIIDICHKAISNTSGKMTNANPMSLSSSSTTVQTIRRSASTGRLPNLTSPFENNPVALENVRRRNRPQDGSGDAL